MVFFKVISCSGRTDQCPPATTTSPQRYLNTQLISIYHFPLTHGIETRHHTLANNLSFDIPLSQNSEEKGHGIDDGHGQAQFCQKHSQQASITKSSILPSCIFNIKSGGRRRRQRTSLTDKKEKPHTTRKIQQQWHSIPRIPEQVNHREERPVQSTAQPVVLDSGRLEDWVRRRRVRACRATDEWRREAPCETDQDEGENIVEDRGRGTVG